MAKDNTTRYIILGLLNHEPLSGYDMKKQIDMMVSQFWNVGYSQIYPTLAGLEKDGLVVKTLAETSKGPRRNVYAITPAGRECLHQWLLLPEEREYTKYEILLKLFFSGGVSKDISARRIADFAKRNKENLALLQLFQANLKPVLQEGKDHLYYYMTVRFGQCVYQAYLDWAEEAMRLLENPADTLQM